jgi:endonuclease/exonuclease/phosphatase family metal-dependent hydrolase
MTVTAGSASAQDIVLHPADVTTMSGNWARSDSSTGAGNQKIWGYDYGWSAAAAPLSAPPDYFEASFNARAGVSYRVWVRMRATANSKWNDAVWLQFTDSLVGGNALYRIGSTNGMLFNLEDCNGCGMSNWGWSGGAWWVSQQWVVQFASDGQKTVRVQTREDGVDVDQIVLSPSTYMYASPGRTRDDSTILPRSAGSLPPPPPPPPGNPAKPLPGTIQAEDFDNGGNGSAYLDTSSGNAGGQYRTTDVDIEACSEGGYNVGWIAAGEWLNYTVNVAAAATYNAEFRVASVGGGSFRVMMNGNDVSGTINVPSTGGWQTWTTVRKSVTVAAGVQSLRLAFDTGNINVQAFLLASGTGEINPPANGPFRGTPWELPGTVQAEDFDLGGSGLGYQDNSPGNAGGAYRTTDVDVEATPNGGYTVAYTHAGEWLRYTVNVTAAGNYRLIARVASSGTGGTFHVEVNGVNRTGAMQIPNTGSWTAYQDVVANVALEAGIQPMRIVFNTNGQSSAVGNISWVKVEVASAPPPPPPPSGGGRFRVATWNIHFGHGNTWAQAQEIANTGADVIVLQEASTYDEHMPTTYRDRLRQLTGHNWQSVWAPGVNCAAGCQGSLILTRLPIVDSSVAQFSGSSPARVAVDVGGIRVNIFGLHLDYFNTSLRTTQLYEAMNWARSFGGPRIVGGDFNSWWGEWWIMHMESEYTDTWQDVTGSDDMGYTLNGNIRFDYLFRAHDQNWRLTPLSCWVHWTNLSDHMPVVADYQVR